MKRLVCIVVLLLITALAPPSTALGIEDPLQPQRPGPPVRPPVTYEFEWDWCPIGNMLLTEGPYPYSPDEHCEVWVQGYDLFVLHQDAVFNCCIDDIQVDLQVDQGLIRITENEVWTLPCYCFCYFPVKTMIHDLPAGDYILEVWCCWMSGEEDLRCSTAVQIPN